MIKRKRILLILLAVLIVLASMPMTSLARVPMPDDGYTLTVKFPVEGMEVRLYKVFDVDAISYKYTPTAPFTTEGAIDPNTITSQAIWKTQAEFYKGKADALEAPYISRTSDSSKQIVFTDEDLKELSTPGGITRGVYLVRAYDKKVDKTTYTMSPYIIMVPQLGTNDEIIKDPVADLEKKTSRKTDSDPSDDPPGGGSDFKYRVNKVWKGTSLPRSSEISVTITYSKDNVTYHQKLNADNNWTWQSDTIKAGTDKANSSYWSVSEDSVPEGYKCVVTYNSQSHTWNIINYIEGEVEIGDDGVPLSDGSGSTGDSTGSEGGTDIIDEGVPGADLILTDEQGRLPQTGLLWWPVPVLAVLGIALLAVGWKMKQTGR